MADPNKYGSVPHRADDGGDGVRGVDRTSGVEVEVSSDIHEIGVTANPNTKGAGVLLLALSVHSFLEGLGLGSSTGFTQVCMHLFKYEWGLYPCPQLAACSSYHPHST